MGLFLKSWFLKFFSHSSGEVSSTSTFVRMEPQGMDVMMEFICSLAFVNRRSSKDVRVNLKWGSIKVTGMDKKSTPSEEPFIIVRASSKNIGTRFKLIGNIELLSTQFLNEGRAIVCLKEPCHNIFITEADPDELKAFIIYLKKFLPEDSPVYVSMAALHPPTHKIFLGCQNEYMLRMENIIRRNINLDRFTDLEIDNCILKLAGYQLPIAEAIRRMKNLTTLRLESIKLRSSTFLEIESKKLRKLYLCYCKTPLPIAPLFKSDLCYKDSLVELHLKESNWSKIPNGIFQFGNLLKLLLSGNCLTELPDKFVNLPNLQELELSNNRLTHLPPSIFALQNLSELSLSDNHISELPDMFMNLSKLQKLSLPHNQLRHLPLSIFALQTLSNLDLNDNLISELPDMLPNLPKLKILQLSNNQFRYVPSIIFKMQNLSQLSLSGNYITELPDKFTNLSKLKILKLVNNQLKYLPPSICSLHLSALCIKSSEFNFRFTPSFGSEMHLPSLKELSYRAILNHKLKVEEVMLPMEILKDLENHHQCVCGCKFVDGHEVSFSCYLKDIVSFNYFDMVYNHHPRIPIRGKICNSLQTCFHGRFSKSKLNY